MDDVGVSGKEDTGISDRPKTLFVSCVEAWIYCPFSDMLSGARLDLVYPEMLLSTHYTWRRRCSTGLLTAELTRVLP